MVPKIQEEVIWIISTKFLVCEKCEIENASVLHNHLKFALTFADKYNVQVNICSVKLCQTYKALSSCKIVPKVYRKDIFETRNVSRNFTTIEELY